MDRIEAICVEDYLVEHPKYFPWKKGDIVKVKYDKMGYCVEVENKKVMWIDFHRFFKLL